MNITEDFLNDFLFGRGLTVDNYFIEVTPVSEMLCYRNTEGREFDLPISDNALAVAAIKRLKALGVKVVKIGC